MRFYRLYIDTDDSEETYHKISTLLGVQPTLLENKSKRFTSPKFGLWSYFVDVHEDDKPFDFINSFLDILESKFTDLELLGIKRNDITFWLVYEYDQQCGMEFHPQEMKRLGESGIVMCIDCYQK